LGEKNKEREKEKKRKMDQELFSPPGTEMSHWLCYTGFSQLLGTIKG
jgi:hypothetical protein